MPRERKSDKRTKPGAKRQPSVSRRGSRPTKTRQTQPPFRSWGGARPGAGRKPKGARAGVSHLRRPKLGRHHPVHVTLRVRDDVENLRTKRLGSIIFAVFAQARERFGVRLVHFCVEHDHLHLLMEADDESSLSRAVQGLAIRLARRLNLQLGRRGSLFADRYHARVLKTPLEVRRCLLYVLNNYRRHLAQFGRRAPRDWADPFSSIDYFDGLRPLPNGKRVVAEFCLGRDPPVAPARTWLLKRGWRRHGLISLTEIPGSDRARPRHK